MHLNITSISFARRWPIILFAVAGIVVLGVAIWFYIGEFGTRRVPDQELWGQFGDYLGGVLGAIFAFLSFLALLYTILVTQGIALDQKDTLELQRLETSFFHILNSHDHIRDRTTFLAQSGLAAFSLAVELVQKRQGRASTLLESYNSAQAALNARNPIEDVFGDELHPHTQILSELSADLVLAEGLKQKFRSYIKTLAYLLSYIDSHAPLKRNSSVYLEILRARLSHIEELFLLYCTLEPHEKPEAFPFWNIIARTRDEGLLKIQVGQTFFGEVQAAFHPSMRGT